MKSYKFYKDENNRWYIDLPGWTGTKAELEMVCGADDMLEIMSQGETEVHLTISETFFEGSSELELLTEDKENGGGWYMFKVYKGITYNTQLWLCDVTRWVFGKIPTKIYIA